MIIGLTYIPGRVFEDPMIICIWKCFEGCKMLCRCKWSYCSAFRSGSRSLAIYDSMWDAGQENVRQAEGNSKRGKRHAFSPDITSWKGIPWCPQSNRSNSGLRWEHPGHEAEFGSHSGEGPISWSSMSSNRALNSCTKEVQRESARRWKGWTDRPLSQPSASLAFGLGEPCQRLQALRYTVLTASGSLHLFLAVSTYNWLRRWTNAFPGEN